MKTIPQNIVKYFKSGNYNIENPVPNSANIEVTNICDLRCKMCRQGERSKGFIELDLVKNFLIEAKELSIKQIGLHTVGESILHPKIGNIIKLCKNKGFYTYMDVNGNSLNENKANELIDSGLDSIKFSIDAVDNTTYSKIRRGGNLLKVLDNIKTLRRIRDQKNSQMCIYGHFIIMKENEGQWELFKTKMHNIVDEIQYDVVNNTALKFSLEEFNKTSIDRFNIPNKNRICSFPWTRIVLSWEGYITLCCIDFNLDMKIDKYEKGNLKSIWFGEIAKSIRKAMIEKRTNDLPIICRTCDNLLYDMVERVRLINEIYK